MYFYILTALCKVFSLARTSNIHESGWANLNVLAGSFVVIGKVNVHCKKYCWFNLKKIK